MPTLPTYNSQRNIQANTPLPLKNEVEAKYANRKAGEGISAFGDKLVETNNTMQYTQSQSVMGQGLATIEQQSLNDPDYQNSEKKKKDIDDLKTRALKSIASPGFRNKVALELDNDAFVAKIKIDGIYKKKEIDYTRNVSLPQAIESQQQIKQMAVPGSTQWLQANAKINTLVDAQVRAGVLNYGEGEKIKNEAKMISAKTDIYNDTATSESESNVLRKLNGNYKEGEARIYDNYTAQEILELKQESQRRIFQNNQTFKRDVEISQGARNDSFIDKLAEGTATFKDIEAEKLIPESAGGMKRETLLKYQTALQKGIAKTLDDMMREKTDVAGRQESTQRATMVKKYNDLIDAFIDDKTDQWKARDMLAQAYVDGIVNPKEQQFLNGLFKNTKDIEFNRSTSPIVNAIKGVKSFMGWQQNASDEDVAFRIKQLVGGVMNGGEPAVVQKQVMSEEVKQKFPDYTSYEKEGRKKLDKTSGRSYVVYPDGSWAWVSPKKTETKE